MAGLLAKQTESDVSNIPTSHGMNVFDEMERMFEGFSPSSWIRPFRTNFPLMSEMASSFEKNIPKVDLIDRDIDRSIRLSGDRVRTNWNHGVVSVAILRPAHGCASY